MPKASSGRKPNAAALGAAGVAPLALALLVGHANSGKPSGGGVAPAPSVPTNSAVAPTDMKAATCPANISNISQCHPAFPTGCTKSKTPNYDAYLNYMKNQIPDAKAMGDPLNLESTDFDDLDKQTPTQLSTGNHADFADKLTELGEGGVRSVVAYLYFSKANPGESSNCQLPNPPDGDFHVLIGFDAAVAKKVKGLKTIPKDVKVDVDRAAIIVEMTPSVRQQSHPNWNLTALQSHWGDQVKVVGQLMIDNEHNLASANCFLAGNNPGNCWRRTVWEIHPVMEFYVCPGGNCTATSAEGWVSLDNAK